MAPPRSGTKFDWRGLLMMVGIYVAVVLLWDRAVIFPLKVFVVLCHEMSHGIAALSTGGRVLRIEVSDSLGGSTVTVGGSAILITSAGYLGSLLFGVMFLIVAARTRLAAHMTLVMGVLVSTVAWRYMPEGTFGRHFALVMGVLLAVVAAVPRPVPEITLRVLGITSCLYAILDIKSDILDADHPQSDASALAEQTGVPAYLWGILWIGTSLVVTVITTKWVLTGARPVDQEKQRTK